MATGSLGLTVGSLRSTLDTTGLWVERSSNAPIVGMAEIRRRMATGWSLRRRCVSLRHAPYLGSMGGKEAQRADCRHGRDPATGGYWLVASDGGVFSLDRALPRLDGWTEDSAPPIVGMAADPATGGYWLVASDGGVFSFRSLPRVDGWQTLNVPIVGITVDQAPVATGLLPKTEGSFSFDARYLGSMGGKHLTPRLSASANADKQAGVTL